ncbi:hypothetical protein J7G16_002818 [Vibrio parahaemolyticus]|nr:hypothetical protein [Vibrio parahaemolyticus]
MEIPEKVKVRLYKLLELTERGVGGEKKNAEARLDALLAKYNIKKDEFIEVEQSQEFSLSYKSNFERRLLCQIAWSIGIEDVWKVRGINSLLVDCSPAIFAELKLKFAIYRKALQDEFELTFHAFIHRQSLYSKNSSNESDDDSNQLSAEEVRRLKLIAARTEFMDRVNVNPCIDSK